MWVRKVLISIFLVSCVIFLINNLVFAQESPTPTPTPTTQSSSSNVCSKEKVPACADKKGTDCETCITNLINEARGKSKSLSQEISAANNQIKLSELRIEAIQEQIKDLERDIDIAKGKITDLQQDINRTTKALISRVNAVYEVGSIKPWEVLLTSQSLNDVFNRLKYLKIVQIYDKRKVYAAQQAKTDYNKQKEIFEDKETEAKALSKKLEGYTKQLEEDKVAKQSLLTTTKNDEARYQALLAQARAERAIVFGGGKDVFLRDVNQGDTVGEIASRGASPGCSTGPHLHFEVHKNGSVQDPNNYLQSTSLQYPANYNEGLYRRVDPRGDLPWPINSPIQINQGFGAQPNSSFYGAAGHLGIDMSSLSSSTVKAAKAGKLYAGSYKCSNGPLYYAKVEHSDGLTTWYLHMIAN